jgi:glycosylphosphatidylinositol transamidase
MAAQEVEATAPLSSNDGATTASANGSVGVDASNISSRRKEKEEQRQKDKLAKQRREKLLRRAVPLLLTVPWFLGLMWTALHPLVSVITGELKCRGKFIDENGLDVHRHRVEKYPLERLELEREQPSSGTATTSLMGKGMCDAIYSNRILSDISPSIECLHHQATDTIEFDVVRILPAMGPVIESTDAVVLVIGGDKKRTSQNKNNGQNSGDAWYEESDLNASILHMIKKLGNKDDCPWLTKVVYIVSPVERMAEDTTISSSNEFRSSPPQLESIVDAFMTSYLGGKSLNSHNNKFNPLPPDFTFPMIRSVLVVNDAEETSNSSGVGHSEVRILPQGKGGILPNLDLVFATFLSFQSYPAGERYTPANSIYYSQDSEFRAHPFGAKLEEKFVSVLKKVGNIIGLDERAVVQYAKDLGGLFGFVAGLVVGP